MIICLLLAIYPMTGTTFRRNFRLATFRLPKFHNRIPVFCQDKIIRTIMALEILTKDDLEEFGQRLIAEIKTLLGGQTEEPKKWLKSYQVKNLLKISPNTLQKLRENGTLNPTKIGGILYYKYEEIMQVLNGTKSANKVPVRNNR
jgi:hypothetical protein